VEGTMPSVWSNWANFRAFGRLFTLGSFFKVSEYLDYFFHGKSYVLVLTKKWFDCILGKFFHELIWSPWMPLSEHPSFNPVQELLSTAALKTML
jgi:hypothetical protein